MKNDENKKIVFMTLIAGRKQKDAILSALSNSGIHLINTIYGKGTVNASYLKNILGLVSEENKVVITCVSTYTKVEAVLNLLVEKFDFDKPNTGIAFTVPIDKVLY